MFEHSIFELNWTFWIFLVMFLGFMRALNAVFLKPVGAVIAKREARIKNDIAEGQADRQRALEMLEDYEKGLRETRTAAAAIVSEATGQVQKNRAAELKRIHEEGLTKVATAKREIDAERVALVDQLVDEEKGLVEIIVHKLLGTNTPIKLDQAVIKHALEESR
jgi:F0F1-type ATP synthase membrane subunit b/b'